MGRMPSGESLAVLHILISAAVFSAVLAAALAYAWRLYGQPYLVHWSSYWALYVLLWTLGAVTIGLAPSAGGPAGMALAAAMTVASFAARALLAVGVMHFLGWRLPDRRGTLALAGLVLALSTAAMGARALAVAGAIPAWAPVALRTYSLGMFLSAGLAWAVLRGRPPRSQRFLGIGLAAAALSDAWDAVLDLWGGQPWNFTSAPTFGSFIWAHLSSALLASGMLVAAIGTERRRAERASEELRRRDVALLEAQRQETIGQLAGGLAHDFNNLLTSIIGHLAIVREGLPSGSEAADDLGAATEAAERAARLTRQLLTYARRQPSTPRLVDPGAVVSSVDRMAAPLLGPRITRRLSLGGGAWPVLADPALLEQLLLNLVVNARDAMPEGGTLLLELANESLGPGPRSEDAREASEGEWVRLTVEDTGQGMDPATRARMFEPFFTTKPPGKGSGLGLSAAQGIVRQVGGTIGVRTAPGQGTRLSVFLPRARGVAEAAAPHPVRPSLPGGTETVLLVEDEPQVRTLASRVLRRRGYAVLTAADGEGALRLTSTGLDGIDLLLTDISMPGMDGRTLARRLRERSPDLAVLFMSGFADAAAGPLEGPLLPKPFTPEVLVERVRETLDRAPGRAGPVARPIRGSTE
jgi:signal transduction histidine kinase/CheY-like chemotaxis protein